MCIAYFIFSLVLSGLRHMIAVYDQQGQLPYVHGMRVICWISDLVFLVGSVYYWGFLAGIVYFVLHFFSVLFCCYGWVSTYPVIFFGTNERRIQQIILWESGILFWLMIAFAVFCIISFFTVPFKAMWSLFKENWIVILSIGAALCVLRLLLQRFHAHD